MSISPEYSEDVVALADIKPEVMAELEKWLADLDAEHARRGYPYGDGSLVHVTGISCWLPFFDDGYSPSDALDEDATNA